MAWGRRKWGPKSAKKPAFLPVSAHFFFLSLSTVVFSHHHPRHRSSHHNLHHRKPTQSPTDHQEPQSVSLSPTTCFFFFNLLPLSPATVLTLVPHCFYHQPATKQSPRLSPSSLSSISLSSATFSSSSRSRRRPPPLQPPAAHRHPRPDHHHARLSALSPLPLLLLLRCPCWMNRGREL